MPRITAKPSVGSGPAESSPAQPDQDEIGSLVTPQRLRTLCPNIRSDILEAVVTDAPTAFAEAGINSPVRIAHFFAQIATEADGLQRLDENLNYTTAARVCRVFGSALFPTEESAKPFLRNPEKLANLVYANKLDNKLPDDGFRYRGSGLIQLTGRGNFRDIGRLINIDLENDPDLARHPDSALQIALGYWAKRDMNSVANGDADADVEAVTRRVTASRLDLPRRKALFRKALKIFALPMPTKPLAVAPAAGTPAPATATGAAAVGAASLDELSGSQWTQRFPTSRSIDDLAEVFAEKVRAFIGALRDAGAIVNISATFRPKERSYLMHWCWEIGINGFDPGAAPPMLGVGIRWDHPTLPRSRLAAKQMVVGYGMVQIAALNSRHTERLAIDMTVSWSGPLSLRQQNGDIRSIRSQPRNGSNPELISVAAGYGVIKLPSDPPHWSDDGR